MKAIMFSAGYPRVGKESGLQRAWFLILPDGTEIKTETKEAALEMVAKLQLEIVDNDPHCLEGQTDSKA